VIIKSNFRLVVFVASAFLATALLLWPSRGWAQTGCAGFEASATKSPDGRTDLAIKTCPERAGKSVTVYAGQETFCATLDPRGEAKIGFVTANADRKLTVELPEMASKDLAVTGTASDLGSTYRVVLQWHDSVQLGLHVIEPGRRQGEYGDINPDRPNRDPNRDQGMGRLDIASGPPAEGCTAQQSYVVSKLQGVFKIGVEYTTRGARPVMPYCDTGKLANVPFQVFVMDHGSLKSENYGTGHAICGPPIAMNVQWLRNF
jgi:hypothetical protein